MERKQKLIIRWSILTASLIVLFWEIWHLTIVEVPIVTSIKIMEGWMVVALPFGISRWWDMLIGPIWSTILIFLLTNERLKKDEDLVTTRLIAGSIFVLVIVPCYAGFGLVFALGIGLATGLVFGRGYGLVFVLLELVFALATGLVFGLVVGLVFALGIGLATGLVFGLGAVLKFLFSFNFWTKVQKWLLARD